MTLRLPKLRLLLPLLFVLLTPLTVSAAAPAQAPQPGVDYVEIEGGRPFAAKPGRIEVVEVFGYTCPHCAHFEPLLAEWKKKQPADVQLVQLAAPFGGYWIPYAKAFYAAQVLGVAERSHGAMFKALHDEHSLPISGATADEIATFYAGHKIAAPRFIEVFNGDDVARRMQAATDFIQRSGVESTPSLIVAGKYRVIGKSFDDLLRVTDALIARERAAMNTAAPAAEADTTPPAP